ncbi:hypothetical protein PHYSODRAFT_307380 [Phytophthora sojae]|uniref:PiggyBac transposable element-derived protein domain-containing protein n=1 Tax=Phytophthora sojae (strain P6497) TaxID=1094619 RepID=G5AE66_PHYSP|nr:hypothetical protein PHYSODRAFT_307380 [Phytophthora sojae]EGZ06468.1 hypothetical protein PHYSODRAFT_307380 [Phytophthora sojae]|eukprot:XP_009538365.1 hypothetical protein PHYSODRAFT_307380 [Phytophthora sojae]
MQDVSLARGTRARQKAARTKQGPPPPPKTGRKTAQQLRGVNREDVGLEVENVITAHPATQSTAKSTKKKKPTPDPSLYIGLQNEKDIYNQLVHRLLLHDKAMGKQLVHQLLRLRRLVNKRRAIEMQAEEGTPGVYTSADRFSDSALSASSDFSDEDEEAAERYDQHREYLQQAEASAAASAELQQRLAISNPDVNTCFENIIDGNESADDEDESCLTNEMIRELMEENDHDWYLDEYGIDVNDDDELLKLAKNRDEIKEWETDGWEEVDPSVGDQTEFGNIYSGEFGPTQELVDIADSPLKRFWYFLPQSLWQDIADEPNKYAKQTVITRARRIRDLHKKLRRKGGMRNAPVESLREIRQRLRKMPPIQPCELHVFLGLLIARALAPIRHRLSAHWSTSSIGAIPSGTFGMWMARNRYDLSWNITKMYD